MQRTEMVEHEYGAYRGSLIHSLIFHLSKIWAQTLRQTDHFLHDVGAYRALDQLVRHSAKHPILALALFVGVISISLPFLILIVFGLSTIVMTFTGFILIEGALITFSSILLFGCLGAVLIVLLFFGILIIAGYFGFMHIYDLFGNIHNMSALINYVNRERNRNR